MIHRLTLGHLDPDAITREGRAVVLKPLDMELVRRLLSELGESDRDGRWTLDGDDVTVHDGYVIVPWQGGWRNRIAEEFALRLEDQTGCVIADREHGRLVEPSQLEGLKNASATEEEVRVT
jgi:hypothetical protein